MHWKPFRGGGWHVIADPPEFDITTDDVLPIYKINEKGFIYIIYQAEKPPLINVKMAKKSDSDAMTMNSDYIDNDSISIRNE